MDRRTLFFVIAMTALFFFMRQWFAFSPEDGNFFDDKPEVQIEIAQTSKSPSLVTPAQRKAFDITPLYYDVDFKDFASLSLRQEGQRVALAWEKNPPKDVYVKSEGEKIVSSRRFNMQVAPQGLGDPALYSLYPLTKLRIPIVPKEGQYPIQMVYFNGQDAYTISGMTEGNAKIKLDSRPPKNSIALLKLDTGYQLYGVYHAEENLFVHLNDEPGFSDHAVLTFPQEKDLEEDYSAQKYYVLENEYQQLVFTNLNGSVCEINLPFKSETNEASVIHPIETDRIIHEDYVRNDTFPQFPFYKPDGKGGAIAETTQPVYGGYYPLLRRNIIGKQQNLITKLNPHYYALNIYRDQYTPETKVYSLKRFEKNLIEFELKEGNRRVTKTYTFSKKHPYIAPYCFDLNIKIEGDSRGLSITSGLPDVELISGKFTPTLKYRVTRNQKRKVETINAPKESIEFNHISPDWICNGNGFFGLIIDPLTKVSPGLTALNISGEIAPSRLSIIDSQYERFPVDKFPAYGMYLPLPTAQGETKLRVFAGPLDKKILERLDQTYTNPDIGYYPDYTSCQSFHGWFSFISQPFSKFLSILINFFHSVTGSWGFSIILLTIALRLMLYPLNSASMRSTAKMQALQPKVTAIQEKNKKDPKKGQMEIMALCKKEGATPFGGCLPMIIQLPFILGMLNLLKSSFQLRGATFIPGWIDNLTAPDIVFSWTYPIPFIGNSFHLLPIILGLCMFFQQRLTSKTKAGTATSDQQRQQKMMGNVMTIAFTFLFYSFPSGLNIYWISTTLLGILQQWWIQKRLAEGKGKKIEKK